MQWTYPNPSAELTRRRFLAWLRASHAAVGGRVPLSRSTIGNACWVVWISAWMNRITLQALRSTARHHRPTSSPGTGRDSGRGFPQQGVLGAPAADSAGLRPGRRRRHRAQDQSQRRDGRAAAVAEQSASDQRDHDHQAGGQVQHGGQPRRTTRCPPRPADAQRRAVQASDLDLRGGVGSHRDGVAVRRRFPCRGRGSGYEVKPRLVTSAPSLTASWFQPLITTVAKVRR